MTDAIRHTAILGGTFDPPHLGHIDPVIAACNQWQFDDCWLLPNHIPPHKQGTHADVDARLAMLDAVIAAQPIFALCDIELKRDTPSYTVETLKRLKELYPSRRFYFVMGMDSFLNLPSWHRWQELFALCHLLVCKRPGYRLDSAHPMASCLAQRLYEGSKLPSEPCGRILLTEVLERDISSTQIRRAIASGEDVSQWLPEGVMDIINTRGLYR